MQAIIKFNGEDESLQQIALLLDMAQQSSKR